MNYFLDAIEKERFAKFIREFHPNVLIEYERSKASWDNLKIGDIVVTLRAGFGGDAGLIRRVSIDFTDQGWKCKYLTSLDDEDDRYLLIKEETCHGIIKYWWQSVVKIDYDAYQKLPDGWKGQWGYLDDLVNGKIIR